MRRLSLAKACTLPLLCLGVAASQCPASAADPTEIRGTAPDLVTVIQARKDSIKAFFNKIDAGDVVGATAAIEANTDLIKATDYYGRSALGVAIENKSVPMATMLLAHGADIEGQEHSSSLLQTAVATGDASMVQFMLGHGAKVNRPGWQGSTALFTAVRGQNKAIVDFLLAAGADINLRDNKGRTPLHEALWGYGPVEIAKMLIDRGADVNARDNEGLTPFHKIQLNQMSEAIYHDLMTLAVAKGFDINARTDAGNNLLQEGITGRGFYDGMMLATLLEKGLDVNSKNARGDTALQMALRLPPMSPKGLQELIAKSDLSLPDHTGLTPLLIALEAYNKAAITAIVAIRPPMGDTEQLYTAAATNDDATLRKLLAQKPWLVGQRLPDGSTALHFAAHWGAPDSVKTLVELGAEVDARDSKSRTPLELSLVNEYNPQHNLDRRTTVKALLARHADPSAIDDDGSMPLQLACSMNEIEIAEAVLKSCVEHKVPLDTTGKNGTTALMAAVVAGRPTGDPLIGDLLDAGARVDRRDGNGATALSLAAGANNVAAMTVLLAHGAEVNPPGDDDVQPLATAAAGFRAKDAVLLLIQHGAKIDRPSLGYSLLERAIWDDRDDMAKLLIEKGANVNPHLEGETPLTQAIKRYRKEMIPLLLKSGADPNMPNGDGKTPMQLAADTSHQDVVDMLKAAGAKQ